MGFVRTRLCNMNKSRLRTALRQKDSEFGGTPLHWASLKGQVEVVQELISFSDAILDLRDNRKAAPLHLACDNGHVQVVQALIHAGADVNLPDGEGHT